MKVMPVLPEPAIKAIRTDICKPKFWRTYKISSRFVIYHIKLSILPTSFKLVMWKLEKFESCKQS